MKVVGITGGIGSGKSTISEMLRKGGYPVFDCDVQARHICDKDIYVIIEIKKVFGDDIYKDDKLDRKRLANIVFNDKESLEKLNSIVHPKVRDYMYGAIEDSGSELFFVESAIMFESGMNELMDYVIEVWAPEEVRIERVISRDNTTKDKVLDRINNQMEERDRMALSNYVLNNNQSFYEVSNRLRRIVRDIKERVKL